MTMEEIMVDKYGPLLNMTQMASLLDRSVDGLRISLRSKNSWTDRINATKLRIGRRVYFRTTEVAALFSDDNT